VGRALAAGLAVANLMDESKKDESEKKAVERSPDFHLPCPEHTGRAHPSSLIQNGQDVILAHDQHFVIVDDDLGSRVTAENDPVTFADLVRHVLTVR